ncbi:hypothetical protein GLOIN_2v1886689 [Rhizophagus clarus]|uniref:CCHC-type domain-containing protein n=1 Tax=Rhizophagus clarus TaxID=94130 RepID=A0A8H3L301_9GLOM|nr:hypothetical protein GLOIN_2v1886689 [Rhizophagus clarus]
MINAPDGTPPPGLLAGATGATVIPEHNVHADEDWSLAGRCPVDAGTPTNTLNGVLNNNNHIVFPDINISQVIYWFKRNCPTVVREQQELIFGTLTQGSDSPATKSKSKTSSHQGITTEDVDRIVNSRIQALQQPPTVQSPASSSGQENVTKADLQAMFKSFQETISWENKTLNNSKKSVRKKAEDLAIRRFLSDLLREKSNETPDIDYDPVDDITDSMAGMTLNSATINAIKSVVRNAIKKCTKCGRLGHTSRKCSVKKKRKSKAKIDESEKHDLSGIATVPIESIGIVRNLPITLAPRCIIHEDFVVVDYHKPTLIFSNQLLKKYKCAMDWDTNELKISLNGKDYIIPVTMHKVKNKLKVNCARTTPKCDDLPALDCISHDLQDLRSTLTASEDDTFKKKVSYEELEKMLYSTFKYNAEINEYFERLQTRYCELLRE